MRKSEILKEAKRLIASTDTRFVCLAIQSVQVLHMDNLETFDNARSLLQQIEDSISPNTTVRNWLVRQANIWPTEIDSESLKAYQLRWIDHMISEAEKEGD